MDNSHPSGAGAAAGQQLPTPVFCGVDFETYSEWLVNHNYDVVQRPGPTVHPTTIVEHPLESMPAPIALHSLQFFPGAQRLARA
jgi:hypothetical protein